MKNNTPFYLQFIVVNLVILLSFIIYFKSYFLYEGITPPFATSIKDFFLFKSYFLYECMAIRGVLFKNG